MKMDTEYTLTPAEKAMSLDALVLLHGDMVCGLESPISIAQRELRNPHYTRLLHAAMGCVTESGELMDQMKKTVIYGREFDRANFVEELGDLMWYIQLALRVLDIDLKEVLHKNRLKLRKRYGEAFSTEKEQNRNLDAERAILENGFDQRG